MNKISREKFDKDFKATVLLDDVSFTNSLQAISPFIYDFVLRMTGSQNKTSETCDEALKALAQFRSQFKSSEELLLQILKTVKNFSTEAWAHDTNQLDPEIILDQKLEAPQLAFEKFFRGLNLNQREVLLLKHRFHLSDLEIKKFNPAILDISEILRSTAQKFNTSLADLDLRTSELVLFPAPTVSDDKTHDLSIMIGSVKRTAKSSHFLQIKLLVVTFIAFGAGCGLMYLLLKN